MISQQDLFAIAAVGKTEEMIQGLAQGADVNARDEWGKTLLMAASSYNQDPEMIRVLLEAGAELEARDREGKTPLMRAAINNKNLEIIRVLLAAGADGKARCHQGKTAFEYVDNMCFPDPEAYDLLLQAYHQ